MAVIGLDVIGPGRGMDEGGGLLDPGPGRRGRGERASEPKQRRAWSLAAVQTPIPETPTLNVPFRILK